MKINWKARVRNKSFIVGAAVLIISFVYHLLSLFGVVPGVAESDVVGVVSLLADVLAFVGVLTDPTTEGLGDSERALTYYTDHDVRNGGGGNE